MIGYAERSVFDPDLLRFYRRAVDLVASVEGPQDIDALRCHELTRAINPMLGLGLAFDVVDGKYGSVDHTWLVYAQGRGILDVYAIGRVPMVQVVETTALLPERSYYRPGPTRKDIRHEQVAELLRFFRSR